MDFSKTPEIQGFSQFGGNRSRKGLPISSRTYFLHKFSRFDYRELVQYASKSTLQQVKVHSPNAGCSPAQVSDTSETLETQ